MDAERLLGAFVEQSRAILGENLVGVYLHGSLAMGCFNPRSSDVDLLVVVREDIPPKVKRRYMEQVAAQTERVLGFCAPDEIPGENLPDICDEAALSALLDALTDRERAIGEVTAADDFTACVMQDGRMLAAAGAVRSEGDLADISLCVHPENRGQGLGRRVLCALIRKIRDAGCIPLYRAEEGNAPSVRLARRAGLARAFVMEGALLAFPED